MTDRHSLPPVEGPAFEQDYKPVSGVAVAAILIAGLFILIGLGTAIAAIVNKRPVLNSTLLFMAGLGLATSIAARIHIRRSEGTRIGLQLVAVAWWLSVLGGAVFGAYYVASVFAIRQQSEKAAADWFELLKKHEIDRSFLMTVPPVQRQGINPADTTELERRFAAGSLPGFRNSELVRFFKRNGDKVEVKSIGMGNLDPGDNGYRLELTFMLKSPEGIFELNVAVTGSQDANSAGREWQISTDGNLIVKGLTAYGHLTSELQGEAFGQSQDWLNATQSRLAEDALLKTLPREEQPAFAGHLFAIRQGIPLPAFVMGRMTWGKVDTIVGPSTFDQLWKRDFFKIEGAERSTLEKQNMLRDIWNLGQFSLTNSMRLQNLETAPTLFVDDNTIQYVLPINILMPTSPPKYAGARIVLTCESAEFSNQIRQMRAQAIADPKYINRTEQNFANLAPHHWRVVRLETNLEPLQAPARKQDQ